MNNMQGLLQDLKNDLDSGPDECYEIIEQLEEVRLKVINTLDDLIAEIVLELAGISKGEFLTNIKKIQALLIEGKNETDY